MILTTDYSRQLLFYAIVILFSFLPSEVFGLAGSKNVNPQSTSQEIRDSLPVEHSYEIVMIYPHDSQAFTQGLFFESGFLYEGTGLYGQSSIRRVNIDSGKVVKKLELPAQFFGEGITIVEDRLIQLVWRSRVGFVYDKKTFELKRKFSYSTEGWGITHDKEKFIMSDGTANLYFLDTQTFRELGRVTVVDGKEPVKKLNELEYIEGYIYANVWLTNRIVIIEPDSGLVVGWIDLKELVMDAGGDNSVKTLNGIAYNPVRKTIYITGKLWPKVYEIKLYP